MDNLKIEPNIHWKAPEAEVLCHFRPTETAFTLFQSCYYALAYYTSANTTGFKVPSKNIDNRIETRAKKS